MKYVCDVCGWIYDKEQGAPDMGVVPVQNLRIYREILSVHCVLLVKKCLAR